MHACSRVPLAHARVQLKYIQFQERFNLQSSCKRELHEKTRLFGAISTAADTWRHFLVHQSLKLSETYNLSHARMASHAAGNVETVSLPY